MKIKKPKIRLNDSIKSQILATISTQDHTPGIASEKICIIIILSIKLINLWN